MDGGGETPHPVLLTGAKRSHLGCLISFELSMCFQNFVVINKMHPFKKKNAVQLSLIDPTPPQELHSCKLGNFNCSLIGTPNLHRLENIQSSNQRGYFLCRTAAVEPTMETPEHCTDIINHPSELGGHLKMDHAVVVVPDFLDN